MGFLIRSTVDRYHIELGRKQLLFLIRYLFILIVLFYVYFIIFGVL